MKHTNFLIEGLIKLVKTGYISPGFFMHFRENYVIVTDTKNLEEETEPLFVFSKVDEYLKDYLEVHELDVPNYIKLYSNCIIHCVDKDSKCGVFVYKKDFEVFKKVSIEYY